MFDIETHKNKIELLREKIDNRKVMPVPKFLDMSYKKSMMSYNRNLFLRTRRTKHSKYDFLYSMCIVLPDINNYDGEISGLLYDNINNFIEEYTLLLTDDYNIPNKTYKNANADLIKLPCGKNISTKFDFIDNTVESSVTEIEISTHHRKLRSTAIIVPKMKPVYYTLEFSSDRQLQIVFELFEKYDLFECIVFVNTKYRSEDYDYLVSSVKDYLNISDTMKIILEPLTFIPPGKPAKELMAECGMEWEEVIDDFKKSNIAKLGFIISTYDTGVKELLMDQVKRGNICPYRMKWDMNSEYIIGANIYIKIDKIDYFNRKMKFFKKEQLRIEYSLYSLFI